jgi:hypothetical protein
MKKGEEGNAVLLMAVLRKPLIVGYTNYGVSGATASRTARARTYKCGTGVLIDSSRAVLSGCRFSRHLSKLE